MPLPPTGLPYFSTQMGNPGVGGGLVIRFPQGKVMTTSQGWVLFGPGLPKD